MRRAPEASPTPYNVAVGGSMFTEGGGDTTYSGVRPTR